MKAKTTKKFVKKQPIKKQQPLCKQLETVTQPSLEIVEAQIQELMNVRNKLLSSVKQPETFLDCVKTTTSAFALELTGVKHVWQGKPEDYRIVTGYLSGYLTPSEKRAKQLAAISKMMTVAEVLGQGKWYIKNNGYNSFIPWFGDGIEFGGIGFANLASAEKAIQILGEETIKTAFGL